MVYSKLWTKRMQFFTVLTAIFAGEFMVGTAAAQYSDAMNINVSKYEGSWVAPETASTIAAAGNQISANPLLTTWQGG